jgi:ornithine cyclodeaminase
VTAIRILGESQVRRLITPAEALSAVRKGFVQLHRGQTSVPSALELRLPHNGGEAHGKGAYAQESSYFTVKVATGFPSNRTRGIAETGGLSVVFDAETGFVDVVLFDNGYLTQLRTGAAGALAADLLSREDARIAAIIGAGIQARFQLQALALVRPIEKVVVASRNIASAQRLVEEMASSVNVELEAFASIREAVSAADIVVTATPARKPIVQSEWVRPGTHITAVGSDFPDKQELDPELLARAVVVADDFWPGKAQGEIHHAIASGAIDEQGVQTLGAIEAGEQPGRESADQVTVADLTGVGVQDAVVAAVVSARARREGVGLSFDPDSVR